MFADEKALRTIEILKGSPFTPLDAVEVYNDLPGPAQCTVHGIMRRLRKEAKINFLYTIDRINYYEVCR